MGWSRQVGSGMPSWLSPYALRDMYTPCWIFICSTKGRFIHFYSSLCRWCSSNRDKFGRIWNLEDLPTWDLQDKGSREITLLLRIINTIQAWWSNNHTKEIYYWSDKRVWVFPLHFNVFSLWSFKDDGNLLTDPTQYRKLVGKLNFVTSTRLEIAYSIQHLNQYM